MAEVRTSVVVEGKSKGLDAIDKSLSKIKDTSASSAAQQKKNYEDIEKRLTAATKAAHDLIKELSATQKLGSLEDILKLGKMASRLQGIEKQLKQFGKSLSGDAASAKGLEAGLAGVERTAKKAADAVGGIHKATDTGRRAARRAGGGEGGGGGRRGVGGDYYGGGGGGGGGGAPARGPEHGAFTQGLLEGIMPGNLSRIIERGPGAFRQAAGIYLGDKARTAIGGLASVPLAGEAGLTRAVEGIPLFGGAGSALLQRSLSQAKQAIAFRQQEASLAPYLGGVGMRHGIAYESGVSAEYGSAGINDEQAKAQAERERKEAYQAYNPNWAPAAENQAVGKAHKRILDAAVEKKAKDLALKEGVNLDQQGLFSGPTDADRQKYTLQAAPLVGARGIRGLRGRASVDDPRGVFWGQAEEPFRQAAGEAAAQKVQQRVEAEREMARKNVAERRASGVEEAGAKYGGMDISQTQQFLAHMAQRGGGTARAIQQQGMTSLSLAAQSVYGIGPEVSGAFVQAGRVGGVAGGGLGGGRSTQKGNEMFSKALGDGIALGLEGSELNSYLQKMAEGIDAWKTTGIPLAQDSIADLGRSMITAGGMGGQRAALAATSTVSSLQQLAGRGPTSETDLLKLQIYGGYTGGGMVDLANARKNIQSGKGITPENNQKYMRALYLTGTGGLTDPESQAIGAEVLRQGASELGQNFSVSESELYGKQLTNQPLTDDEQKALKDLLPRIDQLTNSQIAARTLSLAASGNKGVLEEQAKRSNEQLQSGDKFISAVQDMDAVMQRSVTAFGDVFAKGVDSLAEALRSVIEKGVDKVAPHANPGRSPHAKAEAE